MAIKIQINTVYSKGNAHLILNFLWPPPGGGGPKIHMVDYVSLVAAQVACWSM